MTITNSETGYEHFMVDCETIGTQPNRNPVLQISIVHFCPDSFTTGETFTAYLPLPDQIQAGRYADQGTIEWWGKPERAAVLADIMGKVKNAPSMVSSLTEVLQWVTKVCTRTDGKIDQLVFWAKPVGFDYPFIDGLFLDHKVISPFHYRNVVDMFTHIISMLKATFLHSYNQRLPHQVAVDMYWRLRIKNKKEEATAHNAIADCFYQIKWLQIATENTKHVLDHYDLHRNLNDYVPAYTGS